MSLFNPLSQKTLITCAVTNEASRRVIEANGGVPTHALEPQTLRFRVPTA